MPLLGGELHQAERADVHSGKAVGTRNVRDRPVDVIAPSVERAHKPTFATFRPRSQTRATMAASVQESLRGAVRLADDHYRNPQHVARNVSTRTDDLGGMREYERQTPKEHLFLTPQALDV